MPRTPKTPQDITNTVADSSAAAVPSSSSSSRSSSEKARKKLHHCQACGAAGARLRCASCPEGAKAHYCSRACQISAWRSGHKLFCKPTNKTRSSSPRPVSAAAAAAAAPTTSAAARPIAATPPLPPTVAVAAPSTSSSPSSLPFTSSATATASAIGSPEKKHKPRKKNRCGSTDCSKRLTLSDLECRCELRFCAMHRLPEHHACSVASRTAEEGRRRLAVANPVIVAAKVDKL